MTLPRRPADALSGPSTIRYHGEQRSAQPVRALTYSQDITSPPTPGHDDTPYIRFALEQITLNEEVAGVRSSNLDHFGHGRSGPAEDLTQTQRSLVPMVPSNQSNPPPQPFRFPSTGPATAPNHGKDSLLMPIDPPTGDQWNSLGFVPLCLRISTLATLIFLCLLMIAGIIFSNVYTLRNHGLYDYNGNATARYFIFQYLPQILGFIILLWLFVVQAAIYRVLPYFCISAEKERDDLLQRMPILTANFVLPDLRFFSLGEPLVGVILLIFWLMNFTIPFLSCLYQTQYYLVIEPARWRWSTVQGLGWFLVAWYMLLVIALVCCMIRFRSRKSALMWDPSSISDVLMLFQRSNILTDYSRSEVEPDLESYVAPRHLRLGYWTPSGTHDVYHTVGQVNAPLNRLSMLEEPTKKPVMQYHSDSSESFDVEQYRYSDGSEFTRNIHSPFQRYRWCPWFLRDGSLLAWIIAAILLLIAFLVVSFVNRAVQDGFDPQLPSSTQPNGFSPSNFLYSFLPALLGTWLFLSWQPIDTYFRSVQPYVNLASPQGASAKRSLLQSYSAMPPVIVTMMALSNQDFKLAYITFISLLSVTIPILAGGVFTAQLYSTGDVRMVASMPGYVTMCIFITIYALSFLVIWPTRKRYMPHPVDSIAGQLSFLYASPLLDDPAIRNLRTKSDLVSRLSGEGHVASNELNEKGLTGEGRRTARERRSTIVDREPRYAFGIFIGRDRKEHLGIDRLQRPGSGEMLVTTGQMRPSRSLRSTRT